MMPRIIGKMRAVEKHSSLQGRPQILPRMIYLLNTRPGWFMFAIIGIYVLLASRYVQQSVDDLFIILRYVENASLGKGLVYNEGEFVEGYTCFGWVFLLLGLVKLGWPSYWAAKVFSLVCGGGILVLVNHLAGEMWHGYKNRNAWSLIAPLLLALNPSFLYWASAGLETMFYGLSCVFALYFLVRETRAAREQSKDRWHWCVAEGIACAAAAVTRPEGVILLLFCVGAKLLMWRGRKKWLLHALLVLVVGAIPLMLYLLWRHSYYDYWLPNTYYAKMGAELTDRLHRGWIYLLGFWARNGLGWLGDSGQTACIGLALFGIAPVLLVLIVRRRRAHLLVCLYMVLMTGVVAYEGGDWMPHGRFMILPMILGFALLVHGLIEAAVFLHSRRPALSPTVALVAMFCIAILCCDYLCSNIRSQSGRQGIERHDSWASKFSQHILSESGEGCSLAAADIGYLGYMTRCQVIDIVGLTDARIGRSPGASYQKEYDVSYVLEKEPEYISLPDQKCLPAERIRMSPEFQRDYYPVVSHEGHGLFRRRPDRE